MAFSKVARIEFPKINPNASTVVENVRSHSMRSTSKMMRKIKKSTIPVVQKEPKIRSREY